MGREPEKKEEIIEEYQWIFKVIKSSTTSFQLKACEKLEQLFWIKYPFASDYVSAMELTQTIKQQRRIHNA